jgi:putative ATP-dependent endonuclease of OLD family
VFGSQICGDDPSVLNVCYKQNITDFIPEAVCLDTNTGIPISQLRKLNYFKYDSAASAEKDINPETRKQLGMLINELIERFMKQNSTAPLVNARTMEEVADFVNERFSRIQGFGQYNLVATVATDTSDIVNRLLYLTDGEKRLESTGSGMQYIAMASLGILCYIMGLYKSKSIPFESRLYTNGNGEKILPVILAVDEPEVHLHPYLQRSLINFYHFGKSTTPDQLDQTWVNCLNLFGVEYNA